MVGPTGSGIGTIRSGVGVDWPRLGLSIPPTSVPIYALVALLLPADVSLHTSITKILSTLVPLHKMVL